MPQEHTWISRCLVTQQSQDGLSQTYSLEIACTAGDEVVLHSKLRQLIDQNAYELESIEYSRLIQDHLDKLDYYDHSSIQLASEAANKGFALSEPKPIKAKQPSLNTDKTSHLKIDQLEITLKHSSEKADWQQPWISPELKQSLFDKDINTYLLLDATARNLVTTTYDLDDYDDIDMHSLFSGKLADELKQYAPYLIDMTLSPEQLNDDNLVPKFHRDFFTKHWGKNTGIFIHSHQEIETLTRHLKKFIKIRDTDNKWFFFRFFDPRIMNHYLHSIQRWPQRLAKWYGVDKEHQLIDSFSCEDIDGTIAKRYQLLPSEELKPAGKIELTSEEFDIFKDFRQKTQRRKTWDILKKDYPTQAKHLEYEQISQWCENAQALGYQGNRAIFYYTRASFLAFSNNLDLTELIDHFSLTNTSDTERAQELDQLTQEFINNRQVGR